MTSRLVKSDEDHILPAEFNYGLVLPPTYDSSEEEADGVRQSWSTDLQPSNLNYLPTKCV
jgi:hypothetical protein